jgi:hypothetical protein
MIRKAQAYRLPHLSSRQEYLNENLGLAGLQLASINKALSLARPSRLDRSTVGTGNGELLGQSGKLINIDLAHDEVNIGEDTVNISSAGLAGGEVVDILDGTLEDTLVLLGSVLSGLLGLLGLLTVSLGRLLSVLLALLLSGLGLLLLFLEAADLLLLGEALSVLAGTGLLAELLNTLIGSETLVDELTQTDGVLSLALATGVGVLLLDMTLLVTALSIIGHILIEVLESPPAVKVVPEVVESFDVLLGAVLVSECGNRLLVGEATLGNENGVPGLVELATSELLGRGLNVGVLIDGIELATTSGVEKQIGSLLNTLEEAVVLVALTLGSLLVRVVTQDLLAVSPLDLLGGCAPAVLLQTQNGVVILAL